MSNSNSLFGGSNMMGVCYSPYHIAGKSFGDYTKDDINADLVITAKYFDFIRTYTVQYNQKHLPELCKNNSLGLALGCWIFTGTNAKANTEAEIDTALAQASAYPDAVKIIVIGNEVDLASNNYTYSQVKDAFDYAVKQKATYDNLSDIPLTICMTGAGPVSSTWSPLLSLMQSYAFLTIYPWYGQTAGNMTPGDIGGNMDWSYDNGMVQAINAGLEVVIAEIGWPSAGDDSKDTNWASEVANFNATCTWINGTNSKKKPFITMWFEMFDEPWKTNEGACGPYWGIYGSGTSPAIKTDDKKTTFSTCPSS